MYKAGVVSEEIAGTGEPGLPSQGTRSGPGYLVTNLDISAQKAASLYSKRMGTRRHPGLQERVGPQIPVLGARNAWIVQ